MKLPNILFFLADQHRHDWLGFKGRVPVRTPNIDALAARGVSLPILLRLALVRTFEGLSGIRQGI